MNDLQQQMKTILGIGKLLSKKHLIGLKYVCCTSSFFSQKINSKSMPLMTGNSDSWDEYLLKVYNTTLSSVLGKEKMQFEKETFEPHDRLKSKLVDHLEVLKIF